MYDKRRNGSITIQASKRWLMLFAVLTLVPWCLLLILDAPEFAKRMMKKSDSTQQVRSVKGPWGDLRIVNVVIEPPDEAWAGQLVFRRPIWVFRDYTTNQFDSLLRSAGLSSAQKTELEKAAAWSVSGVGCTVAPEDEFVMNLSSESREVLYKALSFFPKNLFQSEPLRFEADIADQWFANSDVPAATVALVRRLTYTRGNAIMFSDPHLVLPKLGSDLERAKLMKALSRQSTLMVKLFVSPDTDIASLVNYWAARNDLEEDIKPIVESAARIRDGLLIDITHFLPRFARKRLYTYPRFDGDRGEMVNQCYWSSMNFWNDPPDNRFADMAYVTHTLETEYAPVPDNFRFGDVILFMKSDSLAVHSAVYIADNIVFTKNGPNPYSPWILMRLDSLMAHYETTMDLTIHGFRKKHTQLPSSTP